MEQLKADKNNIIPIIDLAKLISNSTNCNVELDSSSSWISTSQEIRSALSGVGFMYLINHGVSQEIINQGFDASAQFFAQGHGTKLKYAKDLSISRHGWFQPGEELLHPDSNFEYREGFDYIQSTSPDPMPELPTFYSTILGFKTECNGLIKKLLKLLGLALELQDPDFFLKSSTHLQDPKVSNESDFSCIYYPPISESIVIPEGTIRCAEHTDYEILTLLFQDGAGGLEIKTKDGAWIPVKPIEGSILVNTGDLLEFWTNGYFPATVHRVIIPNDEIQRRRPRYSFAYFFAPNNSTIIQPIESKFIAESIGKDDKVRDGVNGGVEDAGKILTAYDHIIKRVNVSYGYK